MTARVGWIVSMPRSGSSATAYAAAAPWNLPVADEPFGPQLRTGEPYFYPPEHAALVEGFARGGLTMDERLAGLARRCLEQIGGDAPFVVCKQPHLNPTGEEIARFFPDHRVVALIRNPIHRMNSYFRRKRTPMSGDAVGAYEVRLFKEFMGRWLASPHRVSYDDMRHAPDRFFATIYAGWGLEYREADIERATEYVRTHYHRYCRTTAPQFPRRPASEARAFAGPPEAIEAYVDDSEVRPFMVEMGWSVDPESYLADPVLAG